MDTTKTTYITNSTTENAAKELRNHSKITIFVVFNKTEYHSKLQNILDDHIKFKKLNKNPTNQLKQKN